jgi:kinesin family protein 5
MNTISASEKRNSLGISPVTPQTPLSFHDGTPNSTTSSKTLGNAPVQVGNVSVMCRFRPLNEKEKLLTKDICVEFLDSQQLNLRSTAENNSYKFAFDRIFDMNSAQQSVYDAAARPIIDSVLEGFNGTIFAYGQTSSGKTHTMQGILDSQEEEGIIPRMIRNVFSHIMNSSEDIEFTVKVSMIEIYMEKIRDLIDVTRSNLNIREDRAKGLYIEDLSEHYVGGESEVLELMKVGSENRAIAATNMNEQSSRSHSIFIMTIHQNNVKDLVAKTGKLYLVDLAGSEKISKTGATGSVLDEAKMINKSLTTLGMVINNLTDGKSQHIPYRESKLTRVLSESLGGNAKTCLVITCSPSTYNESETLSTLRFGLRAKKIKNKPKINKEVTVAELKLEIDKLERFLITCNRRIGQLENFISKNNLSPPKEGDFSFLEGDDKKAKVIDMIEEDLDKLKEEDLIINESDHLDNLYFTNDAKYKIPVYDENDDKDKILDDISNKYAGVMAQLNLVEEDKKELNYKLEDAISKIKDFSDTLEHKERLIDELGDIKRNFEKKEQELFEKIKDLQDKLEEKHLITCENYDKSKSNSDIGYASQNEDISNNNSNNNIDVTNNFEEINFKSDLINLNMNMEENKVVDEIYLKIQDVINTCKDGKPVNLQFSTLVEMIKTKINIIDEEVVDNKNNKNNKNIETESKIEDSQNIIVNKINKNINSLNVSVIENIEQFGIIKSASASITNPPVQKVASSLNVTLSNTKTNNTSARASIVETPSASPLISEDAFKKEKRKYEHEKKLILKALEEKSERVNKILIIIYYLTRLVNLKMKIKN